MRAVDGGNQGEATGREGSKKDLGGLEWGRLMNIATTEIACLAHASQANAFDSSSNPVCTASGSKKQTKGRKTKVNVKRVCEEWKHS